MADKPALKKSDFQSDQAIRWCPGCGDYAILAQTQKIFPEITEKKEDTGLHAIFKSVFPINDYTERATVDYVSYDIGIPKYDVEECSQRGMTYGAPLLVNFRLIIWDIDEIAGTKSVRDIKEQEVYMGDIPLMTRHATFVVNGTERVVVFPAPL